MLGVPVVEGQIGSQWPDWPDIKNIQKLFSEKNWFRVRGDFGSSRFFRSKYLTSCLSIDMTPLHQSATGHGSKFSVLRRWP